jgi:integrase
VCISARAVSSTFTGTKEEQVTIGTGKELTLHAARKKAERLYDQRTDPDGEKELVSYKAERIAKEKEHLAACTVDQHFRAYMEKRKDFSDKYSKDVGYVYHKHVLPAIGSTKISKVKTATLKALINNTANRLPSIAGWIYDFLGPFFAWCVDQEYITASPMVGVKKPQKAEARGRILKENEIKALWTCADKLHNPNSDYDHGYPFGPLLKLLLLTGQRRGEVAGMRWDEIDHAKGEWIIPEKRTKNGKEHVVHLSEQARIILDSLPKQNSAYVFTTTLRAPVSSH